MDPFSHAVLGALGAQMLTNRRLFSQSSSLGMSSHQSLESFSLKSAAWCGALAGLAPDLDIFIRSKVDPLLNLEYHRQFTHALVFIPVGAFVVWIFLGLLYRVLKLTFYRRETYVATFMGYGLHGFLDACTNYGTQLLWPFSNSRISWNVISIIDPLFTVPLFVLVVLAARSKRKLWVYLAGVFAAGYLSLGFYQRLFLETHIRDLAQSRGHKIVKLDVKPSFANLLLWRSVYEADGKYFIDALRRWPWSRETKIYEGGSIQALDLKRDFKDLPFDSVARNDIERFRWFSDGYLSIDPERPDVIGDIRFAFSPESTQAMWGLVIDPNRSYDQHLRFESFRELRKEERIKFMKMLKGND